MKNTLKVIVFPFILILSIIGAIIAKPFRLKYTKDEIEIGIVPFLILMIILYYTI